MLATKTRVWGIYPMPKKFDPKEYLCAQKVRLPMYWTIRQGTCLIENLQFVVTTEKSQQKLAIGDIILLKADTSRFGVWKINDSYEIGDFRKYIVELILA